ncbi:type II toxin-antitoxin system RelE/ParE family toxin [Adlercreutzia sp. ZJ141]|uniref:type II toxin-antitoxin system RelE/ParE family toxin n=1 Tax=Adlercreutzia sp. ZJ141 TaxID=2709406 RepID=UPI0013EDFFFB|nr:type II toxin-antitoxin system RelE/ParE family toxin [Adlercreutzia sp. ZJ141]
MKREVRYRPRAAFDLESIVIYVGEVCGNPSAARATYESIVDAMEKLATMPTLGRPFADKTLTRTSFRSWLVGNYRVFYEFNDEELTVWRVIHTHQDIDDMALIDWLE